MTSVPHAPLYLQLSSLALNHGLTTFTSTIFYLYQATVFFVTTALLAPAVVSLSGALTISKALTPLQLLLNQTA